MNIPLLEELKLKDIKQYKKHIKLQAICYIIDSINSCDIEDLTNYYETELFIMKEKYELKNGK